MTRGSQLRLYLASSSPRRLALLVELGTSPEIVPVAIDERPGPHEDARAMVWRLAVEKGRAGRARLGPGAAPGVVLAADTEVVVEGRALGKPVDDRDAARMLRTLSGRCHEVLTAVWLARTDDARTSGGIAASTVHFRSFDDAAIAAYVASGEPRDKAGAYAIQGAGRALVARVAGSWSNVVGLPVEQLPRWLAEIGVELSDL